MSLDKLDYILAVAEEQTLTRAARKLYISQPTLTNYINKLEAELGVKLFDRTVTPVRVTEAGALYMERMKALQQESNILVNELKQMGKKQTVFTLGIGTTRGNHWLPYIVPEFCRRYPDVTLQIREGGEDLLENGVRKGTIDLAFGVLSASYPELHYEEIDEEPVLLAIPREYACVSQLPSWAGTPTNPHFISGEEMGSIPFLIPYPGSGFYRSAHFLMEQAHVTPSKVTSCSNINTAYQLAGAGVGALFLTTAFFLQRYPECEKNLAFCSLQKPIYSRRSTAGYRPENRNRELIDAVIDITRKNVLSALRRIGS